MNIIKLRSRDGTDNYLEEVTTNQYRLVTPFCYRISYGDTENDILFVDPSGGPLLEKGVKVDKFTVAGFTRSPKNELLIILE